jgi:hypothetical protein
MLRGVLGDSGWVAVVIYMLFMGVVLCSTKFTSAVLLMHT